MLSLHLNSQNLNGARSEFASRAELISRPIGDLERKLQCKFHYSSAALVLDLSEVVNRVLGEAESTGRITNTRCVSTVSSGPRHSALAHGLQGQEDVASGWVCGRDIDLRRVSLIEYVE